MKTWWFKAKIKKSKFYSGGKLFPLVILYCIGLQQSINLKILKPPENSFLPALQRAAEMQFI